MDFGWVRTGALMLRVSQQTLQINHKCIVMGMLKYWKTYLPIGMLGNKVRIEGSNESRLPLLVFLWLFYEYFGMKCSTIGDYCLLYMVRKGPIPARQKAAASSQSKPGHLVDFGDSPSGLSETPPIMEEDCPRICVPKSPIEGESRICERQLELLGVNLCKRNEYIGGERIWILVGSGLGALMLRVSQQKLQINLN
ncbi:hypothetical protein CDAR_97121 [Caerostris darwini]|uniref:Uncharacterized protein n=1 Tax=Caerostris darwini TaxID=1538125 RepID=A0AAV4QLZ2_9ARAC|nr:hypothetical protein CDAR_97121 [Caerostris darwini]